MKDILRIECAGGELLPYSGYVEAEVGAPDLPTQTAIFLITPLTEYSKLVPILLGTNVLKLMMNQCRTQGGTQFLQKMAMSTPWWLAFRCMCVKERDVQRSKGKLAIVKCAATKTIRLPGNTSMLVPGVAIHSVPCAATLAMMHPTANTVLPVGIEILPTMGDYDSSQDKDSTLMVEVANSGKTPITIQPRSVLCELQQVEVQDIVDIPPEMAGVPVAASGETEKEFFGKFKLEDDLTAEQVNQIQVLFLEYRDIFSTGDFDIGYTDIIKHRIDVTNDIPFKQRHRYIPPSMYEEVRNHLRQLLDQGIIKESASPWASGVVLVRKKDGKLRFCVDYRKLNERTVKDSHAIPRLEEITDNLKGSKYFSTLDMRSGFYQVEVEEDHKPRTAFTVGPLGFFQFERMPFGLSNSPATFQRLMERAMGELHMRECFTFIDDTIVNGRDFNEHLERVRHVFEKVRKNNLKLNPGKCTFFQKKIKFCGHVFGEDGVETDPEKTARISEWPEPKNAKQLREFLGFAGYYRRFVKGFASIARPLNHLLGGKIKKGKGKGRKGVVEGMPEWKWGSDEQTAFDHLKEQLTSPPVLGYPDYTQPFILHTDASGYGLGAVLCQEQEGHEKVIAMQAKP